MTSGAVDAGWPHQVEVAAEICAGNRYDEVHAFASALGVAPHGGRGQYRDGRDYLRFAFTTAGAADKFQERFGGRRLTVMKVSGRWRDEYLAAPIDIPRYFRELTARIASAVVVPCRPFANAAKNECHENARRYIIAFGGCVVRGWLVNSAQPDTPAFTAHSVVEMNGELIDVTLDEAERDGLRFLVHVGSDTADARQVAEQFDWLVRRVGAGWLWPGIYD
jgi:hypothetical protein